MGEENVIANVSQDSRRSGRVPVDRLLERLERERGELVHEKKGIEYKLREIEDWRRQETSRILGKRMDKTASIRATTSLEAEVTKRKAPLVREIQAIEQRLHDIKDRVPKEDLAPILLRIEDELIRLNRHFKTEGMT